MRRLMAFVALLPVFWMVLGAQAAPEAGFNDFDPEAAIVGSRSLNELCRVQIEAPEDIQPEILAHLNQDASNPYKLCVGEVIRFTFTVRGEDKPVTLGLFERAAPNHVARFKQSALEGFYDGLAIHRSIPGFMIQGGDPLSRDPGQEARYGSGDAGFNLDEEFTAIPHTPGIASTARKGNDVNSGSSQFFLMHEAHRFLDGQYTVFGAIIDGFEVVDEIANLPTRPIGVGRTPFPNPRVDMRAEVLTAEQAGLMIVAT